LGVSKIRPDSGPDPLRQVGVALHGSSKLLASGVIQQVPYLGSKWCEAVAVLQQFICDSNTKLNVAACRQRTPAFLQRAADPGVHRIQAAFRIVIPDARGGSQLGQPVRGVTAKSTSSIAASRLASIVVCPPRCWKCAVRGDEIDHRQRVLHVRVEWSAQLVWGVRRESPVVIIELRAGVIEGIPTSAPGVFSAARSSGRPTGLLQRLDGELVDLVADLSGHTADDLWPVATSTDTVPSRSNTTGFRRTDQPQLLATDDGIIVRIQAVHRFRSA
jgi:hypothetical protein